MKFPISLFYIGISFIVIGSIWTGIVFSETKKGLGNYYLQNSESGSQSIEVFGKGFGFYEISSESYQNNILAKVIDSHGNFLDIRKITNKVTVNYFPFEHSDQIRLEVTNLSDKPVQLAITLGDIGVQGITTPTIVILFGAILLMIFGYRKLKLHHSAS